MQIDHTMVRVQDLDRSIEFYTSVLQMTLFRKKDHPSGEFTLAFLGYDENGPMLELTYNWDGRSYQHGDGFGHLAIATEDLYTLCEEIEKGGGTITRKPGPMKDSNTHIAFVKDPDGYKIELLQRESSSSS